MGRMRLAGLIIILAVFSSFLFAKAEGNSVIEAFFSPEDDCVEAIATQLNQAQGSIDIAMYYFTSRPLAWALARAVERGVRVRVCLDEKQRTEKFSKAEFLRRRGIAVKFRDGIGLMHNKFCIIDSKVVITGSYNWTASADIRNDENLLIIRSPSVAKKYANYFLRLWEGKVPDEKR
jgi:phosphatidylserine/phosphatidylglycerophosphate/cardiolipin synthase-like enzyme